MSQLKREAQSKFCVWTKNGHRPTFFHATLQGAIKEAERLAALQPGDKFIVMHVVDKVWMSPVTAKEALDDVLEKASLLLGNVFTASGGALTPAYCVEQLRDAVCRAKGAL